MNSVNEFEEVTKAHKLSKDLYDILCAVQSEFFKENLNGIQYLPTFSSFICDASLKFLENNLAKISEFLIEDKKLDIALELLKQMQKETHHIIENIISQCNKLRN